MADQAITALPKKTYSGSSQIAATDYLLGIDSAEGYQMLIQDLGEYIINRVTASLAGSNQTLAAAISALNSNSHGIVGKTISATADFNSLTTPGVYSTTNTTQNANAPISIANTAIRLFVEYRGVDTRVFQKAWVYESQSFTQYTRTMKSASEWSAWEKQPTREEINALNSRTAKVFVYTIETDAGSSNWKLESQSGYNFPSVFIFGANGSVINQTIQILGSGVDSIFQGDNSRNLLPVKISNTAFSITVWEYARLSIVSRTPLTITKITS